MIKADCTKVQEICKTPEGACDKLWQYEHIRQFVIDLNLMIVPLINEGLCTKETCPKMKATDMWIYMNAVSGKPQDSCAIEYMVHNLDHSASILNDPKNFKSRHTIDDSAQKYISSIVRRLYRIMSHIYFHHREVFDEFEKRTRVCERFTAYAKKYSMMSADLFIIPDEAFKIEQ